MKDKKQQRQNAWKKVTADLQKAESQFITGVVEVAQEEKPVVVTKNKKVKRESKVR